MSPDFPLELVTRVEKKIQSTLAGVWGEDKSQAAD
jgi:hypothetical protein